MAHLPQMTVHDMTDRLLSWVGQDPDVRTHVDIKRALQDAYREMPMLAAWTYYVRPERLFLNASYDTGTIEFDFSGGANERQVTLTGGVWPTWIDRGFLRIGTLIHDVDRRISDTIITLSSVRNPGTDIAAGTEYWAAQDTYQLPIDFTSGDRGLPEDNWGGMEYVRPQDWLGLQRYLQSSGYARCYTFCRDDKAPGRLAMRIWPPPDIASTLDFMYRSSGRPINTWEYTTGRATTAGGDANVTLTNGGQFSALHVGSVIRLSSSVNELPTSIEGLNPYAIERTIIRLTSSTVAVVDDTIDDVYSAVAFRVSDPLDVEPNSMFNALYQRCLCKLCTMRNRAKELPDLTTAWSYALNLAKEADMRDGANDRATLGGFYPQRLANMPLGPNMGA